MLGTLNADPVPPPATPLHRWTERIVVRVRDERSEGTVAWQRFTRAERVRRAAGPWCALWGLAAVTALVPLVHFVVTPVLLVAGPVTAWLRYRKKAAPVGVRALCPSCANDVRLDADAAAALPRWEVCVVCHTTVEILPAPTTECSEPAR